MRREVFALAMFFGTALSAQEIAGNWQGTLQDNSKQLRIVIEIGRKTLLHSPDQTTEVIAVDSAKLEGVTFKLSADPVGAVYEGKIRADGASITGTWTGHEPDFLGTQGQPIPLRLERAQKKTAWQFDPTAHRSQFLEVEKNVRLEVLDWGGSGRPLVLLAGSGNTAHMLDPIATKLTAWYHVYGITRRGFGASDAPAPTRDNYSADRLGDDVLAVIDALKLNRPVLAGHSLAGEELSSVGSRHPEKVAGLIYLEAAYHWAYYDREHGDLIVDRNEVQRMLEQLQPGRQPQLPGALVRDLLDMLPALQRDLQAEQAQLLGTPAAEARPKPEPLTIGFALQAGMQKYTTIPCPILAIYASPRDRGLTDPAKIADADAKDLEPITAFEKGVPSARVVRLAHAKHFIYESSEADVLREMNSFIATLP